MTAALPRGGRVWRCSLSAGPPRAPQPPRRRMPWSPVELRISGPPRHPSGRGAPPGRAGSWGSMPCIFPEPGRHSPRCQARRRMKVTTWLKGTTEPVRPGTHPEILGCTRPAASGGPPALLPRAVFLRIILTAWLLVRPGVSTGRGRMRRYLVARRGQPSHRLKGDPPCNPSRRRPRCGVGRVPERPAQLHAISS